MERFLNPSKRVSGTTGSTENLQPMSPRPECTGSRGCVLSSGITNHERIPHQSPNPKRENVFDGILHSILHHIQSEREKKGKERKNKLNTNGLVRHAIICIRFQIDGDQPFPVSMDVAARKIVSINPAICPHHAITSDGANHAN